MRGERVSCRFSRFTERCVVVLCLTVAATLGSHSSSDSRHILFRKVYPAVSRAEPSCSILGPTVTCSGDGALTDKAVQDSGTFVRFTTAIVENGITELGVKCFSGCSSLANISLPDSLTTLGSLCFDGCPLISIRLGANVASAAPDMFNSNQLITSVEVDSRNTVYSNDDQGILYDKNKTCLVICPAGLTSIVIPPSVVTIGSSAMVRSLLTELEIPDNVERIEYLAFDGSSLRRLLVGSGVVSFSDSALRSCKQLVRVTVRGGSSLHLYSESGVFGEKNPSTGQQTSILFIAPNVTHLMVESSITGIGSTSLQSVANLTSVTCLVAGTFRSPDHQIVIRDRTVFGCVGGAKNVTLDDSMGIDEIGDNAFNNCPCLTSVTLCSSISSAGYFSFAGCPLLANFDFGASRLSTIAQLMFVGSDSLFRLHLPVTIKTIKSNMAFLVSAIQTINLEWIETFGEDSFHYCYNLDNISLDAAVTIGASCFYGCSKLKSVDFRSNHVLKSIGSMAFAECESLERIDLPETVTDLLASSFSYNRRLTYIGIRETSTSTSTLYASVDGIVYDHSKETIVICPSGLSEIKLLPTTLTIGYNSFYGCNNLILVNMNDGVRNISRGAFFDCGSIEFIRLPSSVSFIGSIAFDSCNRLSKVLYCNNRNCSSWEGDPFPTNPEIYVFYDYTSSDGTFCGHSCIKILDHSCNIPTPCFTDFLLPSYRWAPLLVPFKKMVISFFVIRA